MQDVKNAYEELARKYHPDVNKSETAIADFLRISEAHDWLTSHDTSSSELVYEETEYDSKKREYLQRRWEKERLAKEKQLQQRTAEYHYLRYITFIAFLFGLVLIFDNFLPIVENDEYLESRYQFRTGSKYSNNYENHWITDQSDIRVPTEAYFAFEEGLNVAVKKTPLFMQVKEVHYIQGEYRYSFEVPNLYDFWMILPLTILVSSFFPIRNKLYSEGYRFAAYSAIGFSAIAVLLIST